MVKLRNLLSDSRKIRRRRLIFLSMNITIISWLTEFVGSIAITLMILFPQEKRTTRLLEYLIDSIYLIIVPCTYLMNSSDVKNRIVDNRIYLAITNRFFTHVNKIVPKNNDDKEAEKNHPG